MLEQLYKCAMAQCNNDEALVGHYLDGFLKQASVLSSLPAPPGYKAAQAVSGAGKLMGTFQKGLVEALGKGIAGVGIGLGIHGLSTAAQSMSSASLHTEFLKSMERAMSSNPVLRDADKQKVAQYAETIFKFAPHVATDPNLLSSILANAVHGEGIDPMTIKTLGDLESRYLETKSNNLFSPKSYI